MTTLKLNVNEKALNHAQTYAEQMNSDLSTLVEKYIEELAQLSKETKRRPLMRSRLSEACMGHYLG